jgi:6-phosphogluconolactonase
VVSYRWNSQRGTLAQFHVASTLPGDFTGDNRCNEVAFDPVSGVLYAANTPHDTLFLQQINGKTSVPKQIGWMPLGGRRTRHFAIHEGARLLAAAHQDSDLITTFKIDRRSGRLTPFGLPVRTPSPAFVQFAGGPVNTPKTQPRS